MPKQTSKTPKNQVQIDALTPSEPVELTADEAVAVEGGYTLTNTMVSSFKVAVGDLNGDGRALKQ